MDPHPASSSLAMLILVLVPVPVPVAPPVSKSGPLRSQSLRTVLLLGIKAHSLSALMILPSRYRASPPASARSARAP